jgi:chromosome segregation ATPase
MNDRVSLRLSSVCREIAATRAALDRARQRLDERSVALDECQLRMLIAETPVADLDLRLAIEEHRRLEGEVARLDRILDDLRGEERRLSDRLDRAASSLRG